MKKLLSMLGAIGLVATSSATVVSCGDKDEAKVLDLATATKEISMVGLNGTAPTKDAILKAFNSTNNTKLVLDTDVTIDEAVKATDDTTGTKFTSKITAKDGSELVTKDSKADLTITLVKADLSKLTVKDLTITNATKDLTTPATIEEIFAALTKANKDIMFAVTDLAALPTAAPEIKDGKYSVEISAAADNKDVTGKVTLNITLSAETPAPSKDLGDLVAVKAVTIKVATADLGTAITDVEKVYTAIKEVNSDIPFAKEDIKLGTAGTVDATAHTYSQEILPADGKDAVTGTVTLTVTLSDAA